MPIYHFLCQRFRARYCKTWILCRYVYIVFFLRFGVYLGSFDLLFFRFFSIVLPFKSKPFSVGLLRYTTLISIILLNIMVHVTPNLCYTSNSVKSSTFFSDKRLKRRGTSFTKDVCLSSWFSFWHDSWVSLLRLSLNWLLIPVS